MELLVQGKDIKPREFWGVRTGSYWKRGVGRVERVKETAVEKSMSFVVVAMFSHHREHLSYIYLWSAMNKWMLEPFKSRSMLEGACYEIKVCRLGKPMRYRIVTTFENIMAYLDFSYSFLLAIHSFSSFFFFSMAIESNCYCIIFYVLLDSLVQWASPFQEPQL